MSFSLFWQVVRLSLTAGWMILVLLALRPLLKKAPRRFSCLLWGLVAIRLALPFSFESRVSMVPQAAAAPQKIAQALNPGQVMWVNPAALAANPLPAAEAAAPAFSPASLIPLAWGLGIAAMLLYAAVSYFRLSRQVRLSAPAGKRVYRCDTISTPFILGIVNPKIFLPSDLDERTAVSVLAHEQAHLRRGDHLWKPLGYVLLSIYWFNPLCWVAYFLFCRDVEQACDEAVIERMDTQQKKDYSAALLACAAPNRIQVCPLAFAEVGVKQRIAGVLNYRKPKFWVVTLAALLCVSLTAGLLTDPVKATKAEDNTQQTLPTGTEISTTVGVPLNVRSEPTLNAPAIAMLETGTQIQILRTQSVDGIIWAYVSADTLTENGWVMAIYLNTAEGEALPTVSADVTHGSPSSTSGDTVTVATKGTVDLYASPTVQGRVIFQLEDSSPVTILRIDSIGQQSWAYVQSVDLDRPGWILVDSLNTESIDLSIYDAAPVATPTVPLPAQLSSSILTEEIPATTKEALTLYVSPSLNARTKGELAQGAPVTVIRIDYLGETAWAFVRSDTQDSPGWTLADALDLGNGVSIPSADDMELLKAIAEKQTAAREEHMQSDAFRRQVAQVMGGTATYTYDTAKNVYSEPSLTNAIVAELEAGTVLHQSEVQFNDEGAWAYITADTLPEGGWILAALAEDETSFANMPQALVEGTPAVVNGPLNVRSEPSRTSPVLATLKAGTAVQILRSENRDGITWAYVSADTLTENGWVMAIYLNTAEGEALPTVSADVTHGSPSSTSGDTVTVATKGTVDLYASPTVQGRVIFQLEDSSPVTILRIDSIGQQSWAYVQSVDLDRPGWIPLDSLDTSNVDLSIYTTPVTYPTMQSDGINITEETSATTKEALTLYSSPSLNARTKGELAQGESVTIIRIDSIGQSVWTYIRSDTLNATGWVLADSFDIDGDTLSIPSAKDMELMRVFAEKERDSNSYRDHIDKLDEIIADYISKNGTSQVLTEGTPAIAKENLNVRQASSVQSKAVGLLHKGDKVTVLRSDLIANVSWSYVQYGTEERTGWVVSEYLTMDDTITQDAPFSLTAALEYFQRYIQAIALDTPDKAEGFLYFATEYSREFFRDNYAPVTGWDITAISQFADDLCCIAWSSPSSTDYAFVGQMDGRLYVFRTVHELPEHWKAGLDVAQYEQENAMYMTEALLECYAVTKRLMDFAQPVQVKITQKDGWKPAETPWELDFADAVCGTDTWHFTQEISDKPPQCTILLTAEDGSTARLWDVDGTVLITHPDGTQEVCIADFQGEATYEGSSLLSTIYQWATNLA